MVTINRDYISRKNTYAGANAPKYIVIHETDNTAKGAGAQRHAQAQAAGHLSTSVHYYSGSDGVYQTAEHSDGTWSIGKEYGGNHVARDANNRNSINIEICVNQDGDYNVARQNAIELVKYLIRTTGIQADHVIRHFDAKGKHCPRKMMDNPALWDDFKNQICDTTRNREATQNKKECGYMFECPVLGGGMSGNAVLLWQKLLAGCGYDLGEDGRAGNLSGVFNSGTYLATLDYKKHVGISIGPNGDDGRVTEEVWKCMIGF